MSLAIALRWVHIIAMGGWLGEVILINFVLVPTAAGMTRAQQRDYLGEVFPRVFRMASVLTLTVLITGLAQLLLSYGLHWELLLLSNRGIALAIGATMASLLIAFHFFLEPRAGDLIHGAQAHPDQGFEEKVVAVLQLVPRLGLGILVTVAVLMMFSARGL